MFKVATASLASMILLESAPQVAHSASGINAIYKLPESAFPRMAWTVDDGCSSESLSSYIKLAVENDLRFTFFVYSAMPSWKNHSKLLKPLVESGQIQLANHSHTHRNLTTLSFAEVKKDLTSCHNFIEKNYGVDARPYFRAPYGALSSRVIQAAAEIGYTKPVIWSGSLVDTQNQSTRRLLFHADNSFLDRGIVLSHANNLVVSKNFDALMKIVSARDLSLVTLNDVF